MFACNAQFSMHWGRQCASPDALPDAGPGDAPNLFSLSYCVGKRLKSVNVCLQRPVFNASGPAVCRPQWLAGRWAERRAERRVAWPWWRLECNFLSCFGRIVCGKTRCRVKQVWHSSVLLAVWRRYELRLLKLRELFSFADTLADFNAVEQRQPGR